MAMTLTSEQIQQYMALSVAAYGNYTIDDKDEQLGKLAIPAKISSSDKPAAAALHGSLSSWTLIDFIPNTGSGFAAAAFRNTTTGEIVFTFRGTEPLTVADLTTDVGVFMQDAYVNISSQLDAAEAFFYSILNNAAYSGANYSFTGHSLGGAIASYMTYVTNTDGVPGVGKSVTFNAPGIGGVIEAKDNVDINPRNYDDLVTDYVNESDVIGNYASSQQLGTTFYVQSRIGST